MPNTTAREHLNAALAHVDALRPLVGVGSRRAVDVREGLDAIARHIQAALAVLPEECGHSCHECIGPDACRETLQP